MTSSLDKKTGKRSYVRHSFAERKRVVELYVSGLGCKRIANIMGLDDSMVRKWLRTYHVYGLEGLRPQRKPACKQSVRESKRADMDQQFEEAYAVYSKTLEPTASIARRFRLNYWTFNYHVRHFHPELVAERSRLKRDFK